jgi:toxin ParE1/3/4
LDYPSSRWRVRLAASAERDVREILRWTESRFGPNQASIYRAAIRDTIRELEQGPNQPAVRNRDDILKGLRLLHVARRGRRGRHFVMFRVSGDLIEILRLLHDSMDFARHLPGKTDDPSRDD